MQVQVVSVQQNDSTVAVVLTDGARIVRCEQIAIWDSEDLEATFCEWCELAAAGTKGITFVV
jgi:Mg-chelatase subunit ChlD